MGDEGKEAPGKWLAWAQRSRLEAFVAPGRNLKRYRAEIDATFDCGLSNALIESANTKIRLITRIAFGSRPCPAPAGHPQTPD